MSSGHHPVRAAVYIRVSSDEQAHDGISLGMQEARCREAALAAGATSCELFCDAGFSGATVKRRPALQELLARLGEFDVIVVWKLDRLSRSVRDWSNLMHRFGEVDVGFISVSERFDFSTPWGKAALNMLATFSELFLDILRSNVKAAKRHIAASGRWGNSLVYGYEPARDHTRTISPHPDEAPVVRDIYRWFVDGASYTEIARSLNARKVPQKRHGKAWTYVQVRDILTNPVYTGRMRAHGTVVDGTHEALIGKGTWDHAQVLVARRRQAVSRSVRHFTRLFHCGICGGPCGITHIQRPTGHGDTHLRCRDRLMLAPGDRHSSLAVAEPKAMAVVWRHTELLLTGPALAKAMERAMVNASQAAKHAASLRRKLSYVESQLTTNLEAARRGAIPLDILERENAPLMAKRDEILKELTRQAPKDKIAVWKRLARADGSRILNHLRVDTTVEEQLRFLQSLYDHVELYPDRLVVHYAGNVLPPCERPLPRYYAPRLGRCRLGF